VTYRAAPKRSALAAVSLAVLTLLFAGCTSFGHLFKDPKVQLHEAAIAGLSSTGADLILDFDVTNPNRVKLPLSGVDYQVWVNGERFLAGTESNRVDVPGHGAARVTLPVTIRYDDFLRVVKSLKDHPRPEYDIQAVFRFDVPVVGTVRVPVREHRVIPLPELRLHF
jgi:LEA14-like dessication related protein